MTRDEYLMVVAIEECAEVAKRISKALRFGMDQIQQDADDKPEENPERLTNRERIYREYYDLRASLGMMGIDAWDASERARKCEDAKARKVEHYLKRSMQQAIATPNDAKSQTENSER